VDDVALVLGGIGAACDVAAPVDLDDPCVVAGGDRIEAEQIGALAQAGELEVAVALDARVRREAVPVRLDVRIDHVPVEVVGEVEHEVVDAELLGDAAGVVDVGDAAAAGVAVAAPQPHRDADHLVPGGEQLGGGDRRVDPAAHRAQHLHGVPPGRTLACAADAGHGLDDRVDGAVDVGRGGGAPEVSRSAPNCPRDAVDAHRRQHV
jgi:hypothetical protein